MFRYVNYHLHIFMNTLEISLKKINDVHAKFSSQLLIILNNTWSLMLIHAWTYLFKIQISLIHVFFNVRNEKKIREE